MSFWMTFTFIAAIMVIAACLFALGYIFHLAYKIEREKKFKRPNLLVVKQAVEDEAS